MKTHQIQCRSQLYSCVFCAKEFSRKFNCDRHHVSCAKRIGTSSLVGAPNVALEAPNVALEAPNVALEAPNVALEAPNVALEAPNVALEAPNVAHEEPNVAAKLDDTKLLCVSCNKLFANAKTLAKHFKCCKEAGSLQCSKCKQEFPSRWAKRRHVKKCAGIVVSSPTPVPQQPSTMTPSSSFPAPSGPLTTNNVVVLANNVNMNQQSIVIQINAFGKEDLEGLLTPEYLDQRLRELNGKGIFRMVKDVHFDQENRPHNNNIRMGSRKQRMLRVKDENGDWINRAKNDILDTLISMYKRLLTIRSFEPDFRKKYENDFFLIQQDLLNFTQTTNPSAYYGCCTKIMALIENMELYNPPICSQATALSKSKI